STAGWAQYRWTPSPRLSITPGVRFEHWDLYDQSKASPWLLTDFEVRSGTHLRVSGGVQHQSATIDTAIYAFPDDPLTPMRGATIEGGIEQRIGSSWRANLSAYHRKDDDLLRFVNAEVRVDNNNRIVLPSATPYWDNRLKGDTTGVEFVVERRAVSGLNGWVSYAWSDSQLDDTVTGESFPSDFDQRHTLNT